MTLPHETWYFHGLLYNSKGNFFDVIYLSVADINTVECLSLISWMHGALLLRRGAPWLDAYDDI